ncbi:hypothetical protein Bbelb_284020 [Branchiostoma belcheri]|nr:hypothetical protein Bbelb_284020 [Branchiostoma belcheri]
MKHQDFAQAQPAAANPRRHNNLAANNPAAAAAASAIAAAMTGRGGRQRRVAAAHATVALRAMRGRYSVVHQFFIILRTSECSPAACSHSSDGQFARWKALLVEEQISSLDQKRIASYYIPQERYKVLQAYLKYEAI